MGMCECLSRFSAHASRCCHTNFLCSCRSSVVFVERMLKPTWLTTITWLSTKTTSATFSRGTRLLHLGPIVPDMNGGVRSYVRGLAKSFTTFFWIVDDGGSGQLCSLGLEHGLCGVSTDVSGFSEQLHCSLTYLIRGDRAVVLSHRRPQSRIVVKKQTTIGDWRCCAMNSVGEEC